MPQVRRPRRTATEPIAHNEPHRAAPAPEPFDPGFTHIQAAYRLLINTPGSPRAVPVDFFPTPNRGHEEAIAVVKEFVQLVRPTRPVSGGHGHAQVQEPFLWMPVKNWENEWKRWGDECHARVSALEMRRLALDEREVSRELGLEHNEGRRVNSAAAKFHADLHWGKLFRQLVLAVCNLLVMQHRTATWHFHPDMQALLVIGTALRDHDWAAQPLNISDWTRCKLVVVAVRYFRQWLPSREQLHCKVCMSLEVKPIWIDRKQVLFQLPNMYYSIAALTQKQALAFETRLLDHSHELTFVELHRILAWLGYAAFELKPFMSEQELAETRPFLWWVSGKKRPIRAQSSNRGSRPARRARQSGTGYQFHPPASRACIQYVLGTTDVRALNEHTWAELTLAERNERMYQADYAISGHGGALETIQELHSLLIHSPLSRAELGQLGQMAIDAAPATALLYVRRALGALARAETSQLGTIEGMRARLDHLTQNWNLWHGYSHIQRLLVLVETRLLSPSMSVFHPITPPQEVPQVVPQSHSQQTSEISPNNSFHHHSLEPPSTVSYSVTMHSLHPDSPSGSQTSARQRVDSFIDPIMVNDVNDQHSRQQEQLLRASAFAQQYRPSSDYNMEIVTNPHIPRLRASSSRLVPPTVFSTSAASDWTQVQTHDSGFDPTLQYTSQSAMPEDLNHFDHPAAQLYQSHWNLTAHAPSHDDFQFSQIPFHFPNDTQLYHDQWPQHGQEQFWPPHQWEEQNSQWQHHP